MSKEPIYVLGSGGHARVIRDIIEESKDWDFAGFVDIKACEGIILEDEFIGNEQYKGANLALGIGENFIREKLYNRFSDLGFVFPVIQSPSAIISKSALFGEGSIVFPGAIVNVGAYVGLACVINTGAIIEHDVKIGNFSSAAPGSVICGDASIGEGAYIGANATVLQSTNVGQWSVVGAGAAVIDDIGDNMVAAGCPAKIIKSKTKETAVF